MHSKGVGFKKDEKKGFNLLQEASNAGLFEGKLWLAAAYLNGTGCEKSPQQAVDLAYQAYLISLENGEANAHAVKTLALILLANPAFDYKYGDDTRMALNQLANSSFPFPQLVAHQMIYSFAEQNRLGFTQIDKVKSIYKAAELGDAQAKNFIEVFEKDKLDKLSKAEQGDADAQLHLMYYYYQIGDNLVPDPQRAIYYAQKLAAQNHPKGFVFLAVQHMQGIYLPANKDMVLTYMQTAANMGDPEAIKFMSDYQARLQQQQQQALMQLQMLNTMRLVNQINKL